MFILCCTFPLFLVDCRDLLVVLFFEFISGTIEKPTFYDCLSFIITDMFAVENRENYRSSINGKMKHKTKITFALIFCFELQIVMNDIGAFRLEGFVSSQTIFPIYRTQKF